MFAAARAEVALDEVLGSFREEFRDGRAHALPAVVRSLGAHPYVLGDLAGADPLTARHPPGDGWRSDGKSNRMVSGEWPRGAGASPPSHRQSVGRARVSATHMEINVALQNSLRTEERVGWPHVADVVLVVLRSSTTRPRDRGLTIFVAVTQQEALGSTRKH